MAEQAITYQLESKCKAGGSGITPACAKIPSVATVAYTFSPAAKLVAVRTAKSSLEEILTAPNILSQSVTVLHSPCAHIPGGTLRLILSKKSKLKLILLTAAVFPGDWVRNGCIRGALKDCAWPSSSMENGGES